MARSPAGRFAGNPVRGTARTTRMRSVDRAPYHRALGFWVIGTYKLAKAVLLLAAGCFTLHLAQTGADGGAAHLAARLGLVPGHRFVRMAIARLGTLDR